MLTVVKVERYNEVFDFWEISSLILLLIVFSKQLFFLCQTFFNYFFNILLTIITNIYYNKKKRNNQLTYICNQYFGWKAVEMNIVCFISIIIVCTID